MVNDLVKNAHYNRAKIFYNQGNFEDAKDEVEEALTIDSNYQDAQQLLKRINRRKNRGRYFALASVAVIAIILIFTVFRSHTPSKTVVRNRGNEPVPVQEPPTEHIDHAKIGYDYLENEEYNKAIEALKKAISIDSNDEKVYNSLGIAYYCTRDYEAAIDAFKEGISLNPQLKQLHYNLGCAYFNVKKFNEAKSAVEEALKIDPNYESASQLLKDLKPLPPKLSIEQLSLIEPSGEGFLDANETAQIKFTVRNSGGTVSDIMVWLEWDSIDGLSYKPQTISTLPQNRTKTIEIPITASGTVKGKNLKVEIQLMVKNGETLVSRTFDLIIRPLLLKPIR